MQRKKTLHKVTKIDSHSLEQTAVIKLLTAEAGPAPKIQRRVLKALGSDCLGRTQVFEWTKRFREGKNDFLDQSRPDRSSIVAADPAIVV